MTVYAVSLSASQGSEPGKATAYLSVVSEGRHTDLRVEWQLPTAINADGNPGEWLYAVLSRLVQDFDEHTITYAALDGHSLAEEVLDARP